MRTICATSLAVCFVLGFTGRIETARAASAPFMLTGGFAANGTYSNSFAGQNHFAGSTATGPTPDRRNFFIFSIPSFPMGVASGKLTLRLPGPPDPITPGYISDDPSETYRLSDTGPYVPADFTLPSYTVPAATAIHSILGSGTLYGSATVTAAMAMGGGSDIDFFLTPPAIASINASMGGFWVVGGQVTTLDGTSPDELIWGYTDLLAPYMIGVGPRLELIPVVPEPGALSLIVLAVALQRRRRRPSRS